MHMPLGDKEVLFWSKSDATTRSLSFPFEMPSETVICGNDPYSECCYCFGGDFVYYSFVTGIWWWLHLAIREKTKV